MSQTQYSNINKEQRKKTIVSAVLGGIIIAMILLITTVWVSNGARNGTNEAVNRVSEFYLKELAGRRAQVVAEELKNHFAYMDNALAILQDTNPESQTELRKFLGMIKKLYGLDTFALIDENEIVYTEHNTTSGLNKYSFLSGELPEPVITTANLYGAKKQVVLATPVKNITFQKARIKTCFIQLNIDEMLSSLTLQTNNNETFCSLYYYNGESLTNEDFGNVKAEKIFFLH